MTDRKYEKYIIYETEKSPLHPSDGSMGIPMVNITDAAVKGAFYFECAWFTTTLAEDKAPKPHRHDFDEILGIFGSNPKDFHDLFGEIEFCFDDEKYIITRSCSVFIPKGIWHAPIFIRKIDTPILFMSTAPVPNYTQEINRDPKWSHLKDPPGLDKIAAG